MLASEEMGKPVVFIHLDIILPQVNPETPGIDAQITELVRRFHAREPSQAELDLLRQLAEPLEGTPVSAREFAKTLCYAVATTTEFVFH